MTITLLRHAQVASEYQDKYIGHLDIPLSPEGKEQAKQVSDRLSGEDFDAVYCSDLLRAKQTLEAFKLDTPIVYTDELREKSWGVHEGKSMQELQASGIPYESFEDWIELLDGEDFYEYVKNVQTYFKEVIYKLPHENILIVTHSGLIKSLIMIQDNLSLQRAFEVDFPYGAHLKMHIAEDN